MATYYLEFEKPIKEIDQRILELKSHESTAPNIKEEIISLESKRDDITRKIFSRLNRWQRVQLARHPDRPFSLDYIRNWSPEFIELHGDRCFADDSAIVAGLGSLDGISVAYLGQQKGRNTKENIYRNFGMMHPEGYRKALRIMKLAEKFNLPIISLLDTQGAFPGIGAEERGQGEAIARNLLEMSKLKVPIIAVVIGEGASGGALGIGICDRQLMLENSWYSVISPEGCASILWHDSSKASNAAEALKVTPRDLEKMGICDKIIEEPLGGAHRDPQGMSASLKAVLSAELKNFKDVPPERFLNLRIEKYDRLGAFTEVH